MNFADGRIGAWVGNHAEPGTCRPGQCLLPGTRLLLCHKIASGERILDGELVITLRATKLCQAVPAAAIIDDNGTCQGSNEE